jgi:alpha-D-ribose 1-methylphosphonate 5-triphosphate diphosphatase PhnM
VTDISIKGGQALLGGEFRETSLQIAGGNISAVDADHEHGSFGIDARCLKVLPGIVDLHGDAFERQMMPRPGVDFPVDVALADSDRQAISNGITTVYHGTTWSWEPGLRSGDNARQLLEAIETLRPQLSADTRFHLRHETRPAMRKAFRAEGVGIAEFPVNEETAREAAEAGDFIVFGAPNVLRGGSHTGWTKAADMAEGYRADIILVDDDVPMRPRIAAVIAAGRLVHLTDASRLMRLSHAPRKEVAAA